MAEDASTLRLLVATDTHLGFMERDVVRRNDSFVALEEIFELAKRHEADALLLAGDLFHDNKPSRPTHSEAMAILARHVLGNRAVCIDYLSDPATDFAHTSPRSPLDINWLNPNLNIGLPVLVLHGNHDDPSGAGGLSCLDPLHASGLVNYMGKSESLDQLVVSPLLLRKNETKLAIYPVGAMKDERLHKLFRAGKVELMRPQDEQEQWFNLCVVHQNRAKHGETNYLPEAFLPDFLHLVVWGHEHECRIEPEVKAGGDERVFITQPGSSVATSLSEGEARPKHVAILDIKGTQFKLTPIPLQTVRPLIFRSISLDECQGLNLEPSKISGKSNKQLQLDIENYLKGYVEDLLQTDLPALLTGHPRQPQEPLVRVRVEYTDEAHQLTPGLFGNNFEGRVANPSDILLFKKRSKLGRKGDNEDDIKEDLMDAIFQCQENDEELPSMENFITDYFTSVEEERAQLRLLGSLGIKASMKSFVEKDERDAVDAIVELQLDKTIQNVVDKINNADNDDHDWIDETIEQFKQQRELSEADFESVLRNRSSARESANERRNDPEEDLSFEDERLERSQVTNGRRGSSTRASRASRGSSRGTRRQAKVSPIVTSTPATTATNGRSSGRTSTRRSRGGSRGSATRGGRQSTITDAFSNSASQLSQRTSNRRTGTQSAGRSVLYDSDSE